MCGHQMPAKERTFPPAERLVGRDVVDELNRGIQALRLHSSAYATSAHSFGKPPCVSIDLMALRV